MARKKGPKRRAARRKIKPVVIVGRPYTPEYGGEDCNVYVLTIDEETVARIRELAAAARKVRAAFIQDYRSAPLSVYSKLPRKYALAESALDLPEGAEAATGEQAYYLVHNPDNAWEGDDDEICSDAEAEDNEQNLELVYLRVWTYGTGHKHVSFEWEFNPKHGSAKCETPSLSLAEVERYMRGEKPR